MSFAGLFFYILVSDGADELTNMNDFGMWMLGGFVLAVAAAIAITFIRLRWRDKQPRRSQVVSIRAREQD